MSPTTPITRPGQLAGLLPGQSRRRPERMVVCGDNGLAHRLVDELSRRYHERVLVVLPSRRLHHGQEIARLPGVRLVEAPELTDEVLESVLGARGGQRADALALTGGDDRANVHTALRARAIAGPDLHPGPAWSSRPGSRRQLRRLAALAERPRRTPLRERSAALRGGTSRPKAGGPPHLAPLADPAQNSTQALVLRVYSRGLARRLGDLLGDATVLSPADVAAPGLVAQALDHTGYVAQAGGVPLRVVDVPWPEWNRRGGRLRDDDVCVLAERGADETPRLLPATPVAGATTHWPGERRERRPLSYDWRPDADRCLAPGEWVIVAATREGLSRLAP